MDTTKQEFFPGDRVRITEDTDEFEIERPDQTFIVGTKGSIGIIVTPEEFWADYVERMRQAESLMSKYRENSVIGYESLLSREHEQSFIAGVKSSMEANFRYPVKFETVEPSADPKAVICCKVGECQQIRVFRNTLKGEGKILEKIE
ncbi:MAG TPA: hypothetical protein VJM08_11175 [Anaerolineales bacterium]|nr:hypothetical protein [Anaerolineales bacterium]